MQQMSPTQFVSAPRRDPAPSRWGYRYQRLMLTPGVRRMVRVGIPLMLIVIIAAVWFGNEGNRAQLSTAISTVRASVEQRPEFMVTAMAVDGAAEELAQDVRTVLPVNFPISSFDLDLELMRETLQALGGVEAATLRVRPGGILQIDIMPRVPVAVWRDAEGLRLVDQDGVFIAPLVARTDRLDLPLVAGDGAREEVAEALALFNASGPLASRIRGLVRMGERRWDVALDRNQRVQLPTENPVAAFERVVVMAQTQDLLERNVLTVDMRNMDRPTIRLGEQASADMRRINALFSGAGN